ncbi:MAG TPA: alpha/beta fold hydrolase [Saprospiraceae bacterium]|nr:alpha/beta fold hydrolase [Saprospiraceae bacterium]MCB9328447.1 alpha/beta fold hydrolase [Lewinellaceae bacterium]HPQ22162.1 alpha/beta fold hydrolase [Saprospiraceae bacterium]
MSHLNYKIIGEGHPIVFLHGLFGMLDNWQTFARKLSEHGYMCIIVDQRNHGRSFHSPEFNYELLSDDLHTFLDEMHIFKTHLLGHSMGGKTALKFTSEYEDYVEKLIVVDIGLKSYRGGHELILDALNAVQLEEMNDREAVQEFLGTYGFGKEVILFLMKNLSRGKDGNFYWKMNLKSLTDHYDEILESVMIRGEIDVPTLFVKGEKSRYIIDEDWPLIHSIFPNAELQTVKGAGHWVHADAPEELLSSVLKFLMN